MPEGNTGCPIPKFPWPIRKISQVLRIQISYLTNPFRSSFHWGPHLHLQALRSLLIAVSLYSPFPNPLPWGTSFILLLLHRLSPIPTCSGLSSSLIEDLKRLTISPGGAFVQNQKGACITETITSLYAKKKKKESGLLSHTICKYWLKVGQTPKFKSYNYKNLRRKLRNSESLWFWIRQQTTRSDTKSIATKEKRDKWDSIKIWENGIKTFLLFKGHYQEC